MHIVLGLAFGLAFLIFFLAFSFLVDAAYDLFAAIRRPYEQSLYYSNLKLLLIEGNWKEADRETGKIMLRIMGRTSQGFLRYKDISHFPKRHLVEISHLWIKHKQSIAKCAPKIYLNGEVLKGSGLAAQLKIYHHIRSNHLYRHSDELLYGCTWHTFSNYIGNNLQNPRLFPLCIGENGYPVWLDCSRN